MKISSFGCLSTPKQKGQNERERMSIMSIADNYRRIREAIPQHVAIVAACKNRTPGEIIEVIHAGVADIGENYVQGAESMYNALGEDAKKVRWHMIGHLQRNKVKRALRIFDVMQSIDSLGLAEAIDRRVPDIDRWGDGKVPVYIEINIGSEFAKHGLPPDYEEVRKFIEGMSGLEHLSIEGLMTMGPRFEDPEKVRPYFGETREMFERIKSLNVPNVNMKYLSMGMTNSYEVAIQEGSNMVRIGTAIFGERPPSNPAR